MAICSLESQSQRVDSETVFFTFEFGTVSNLDKSHKYNTKISATFHPEAPSWSVNSTVSFMTQGCGPGLGR